MGSVFSGLNANPDTMNSAQTDIPYTITIPESESSDSSSSEANSEFADAQDETSDPPSEANSDTANPESGTGDRSNANTDTANPESGTGDRSNANTEPAELIRELFAFISQVQGRGVTGPAIAKHFMSLVQKSPLIAFSLALVNDVIAIDTLAENLDVYSNTDSSIAARTADIVNDSLSELGYKNMQIMMAAYLRPENRAAMSEHLRGIIEICERERERLSTTLGDVVSHAGGPTNLPERFKRIFGDDIKNFMQI